MNHKSLVALSALAIGIISFALVFFGNPANMGYCIACFVRDSAGALGFHRAEIVQYLRPELIGLILGSMISALIGKEFKATAGSSTFTRFVLGICVMIGALMFLGCPTRMIIRIGGGDLNAVVGLVGFVVGISIAILFFNKGFTLQRSYPTRKIEGLIFPAINVVLLIIACAFPFLLFFSKEGPGSQHAPIAIALVAGLVVGFILQKSRFCTVGGIRDTIMFKDTTLLIGFIVFIATVAILNLISGSFNLGFDAQPVAHADGVWNFLGMVLVGFAATLLGGCPMRQFALSGQGSSDATITIIGMVVGAAICHNFGLASSPAGPTLYGQIAVIACLIITALIGLFNIQKA